MVPPKRLVKAVEMRSSDSISPISEELKPAKKRKAISIAPVSKLPKQDGKGITPSNGLQRSSSRPLEDYRAYLISS